MSLGTPSSLRSPSFSKMPPPVAGNGISLLLRPWHAWVKSLPTPVVLQLLLGATWLSVLLFWLVAYAGLGSARSTLRQLDRDTIPTTTQAYKLSALLHAVDESATRLLRANTRPVGSNEESATDSDDLLSAYNIRRDALSDALMGSVEQLSLGAEERASIKQFQSDLRGYDAAVTRALTLQELPATETNRRLAREAVDKVWNTLSTDSAPSLSRLQNAKETTYTSAKSEQAHTRQLALLKIAGCGLFALVVLCVAQSSLYARTRRILNPGLGLATLLIIVLLFRVLSVTDGTDRAAERPATLGTTVDNAVVPPTHYAQLYNLARARDLATSIRANESHALYASDEGARQTLLNAFNQKILDLQGLVRTNLGYSPELDYYWTTHRTVFQRLSSSPDPQNTQPTLDTLIENNTKAFADLDSTLNEALENAQNGFQRVVDQSSAQLRSEELFLTFSALAVALLALLGIAPRLREYAL